MRHGLVVLALVTMACGSGDTSASTTASTEALSTTTTAAPTTTATTAAPTTTTAAATTTTAPTTTTTTTVIYGISDEYVVETVAIIEESAAGGLSYADGFLYTADFGFSGHTGETVFKVGLDGSVEAWAMPDGMQAGTGNQFAPDGTLYQSSYNSGDLFAIAPDGTATVVTDQLAGPAGIAISPDGRVFVDDCNSNRVYQVLDDGTLETFARHTRFQCPNGLTMDDQGNLYLANFNHGLLHMITPEGEVSILHEFPSPLGHVIHHDGCLFVTARRDHVVYRYDLATGAIDIIAGVLGVAGADDGPGAEATIARPNALAVGPDGTVYLNHGTETGNNPTYIRAIRPIDP